MYLVARDIDVARFSTIFYWNKKNKHVPIVW